MRYLKLADVFQEFKAVHGWHLYICEYDINLLVGQNMHGFIGLLATMDNRFLFG